LCQEFVEGVLAVDQALDLVLGVSGQDQVAHIVADAGADIANAARGPAGDRAALERRDAGDKVIGELNEPVEIVDAAGEEGEGWILGADEPDEGAIAGLEMQGLEGVERQAVTGQVEGALVQGNLGAKVETLAGVVPLEKSG
jgi:hypothetical protein